MKHHIPPHLWEDIFKKMEENRLKTAEVTFSMKICKSTFYRKRKEHRNGGVLPRKAGNGRKRIYQTEDYEALFRDILKGLHPAAGHKRLWIEARKRGVPFGKGVCYRILKELNLLVPKVRGRCRKRPEPLIVDGPNQIYLVDTTVWVVGQQSVRIYVAMDAHSRWVPAIRVFLFKTAESTVEFVEEAFNKGLPASLHTDNGLEFANRKLDGYLEMRQVIHKFGPSYTPEAQGLIERFIKTMKTECLEWADCKNIWERQDCLDKFREDYNNKRPHTALGFKTPSEVHFIGKEN